MNAQIRPNRLEVSDRFPVLGFTIRTDEPQVRAEVAVATEPSLFLSEMKAKRTPSTFYSSRATGPLALPRGEAVYLVPPEVLARFVGQERLFVGLAVSPMRNGVMPQVAVMPTEGSPYISLKGLTARSLKRVRVLPRSAHRGGGYGINETAAFEWAGDTATPEFKPIGNGTSGHATPSTNGGKPSSPSSDQAKSGAPATPVDYDDGFGPLPGKPESAGTPGLGQTQDSSSSFNRGNDSTLQGKPVAPAATLAQRSSGASSYPVTPARSFAGSAAPQTPSTGKRAPLARAQEILTPFYDPADPATALTCQNDAFSLAREEWFAGVPNTGIFPHSAICQLLMTAPDGKTYQGTGFYIGRNRLLTCAHNLYQMSSVTIIPGRNGAGSKPFGQQTVQSSSWRVAPNYSGDGDWNNDIAVIDNVPLAAPNGQWFQFLNATPSDRLPIVVCGYSAGSRAVPELTQAIDGDAQHLHGGYATEQSNLEVIEYPILTLMGASGSPVYNLSDRSGQLEALVCAVHVTGEPAAQGLNRGCFITPAKIDWIEGRTTAFSRAQDAPDPLQIEITEIAGSSDIARYSWQDRGVAPAGYIKGMALVYARVYSNLKSGDAAALEMAKAKTADPDRDALAWYDDIFAAAGMSNDTAGVDTLRHLFVLLIGLGMRESSGKYCEGRDRSAGNITAETAEAGMFQTSFNARRSSSLLPTLFAQYSANPSGFLDVFQEGVHCSASNLENFGSGDGREFQRLSKECPAFAAEFAAVGLRNVRGHWGPITRRGAEVRPECDTMLQQVEACVDAAALSAPSRASRVMSSQSFSVHWDTTPYYPQSGSGSCWAASAAMVAGWRDNRPVTDAEIAAKVPVFDAYKTGLFPTDRRALADAWNLVPEPPASYTIDTWTQLLRAYGPLYVDMTWDTSGNGGHVRVLVGMDSDGAPDGSDTTMYMHDPWPGTPGKIKLPFTDFLALYENRTGNEGGYLQYQILHADRVPSGRVFVTTAPFALTMAEDATPATERHGCTLAPAPAPIRSMNGAPARTQGLLAGAIIAKVIDELGTAIVTHLTDEGEMAYETDSLEGFFHPNDVVPDPPLPSQIGRTIEIKNWPRVEGTLGPLGGTAKFPATKRGEHPDVKFERGDFRSDQAVIDENQLPHPPFWSTISADFVINWDYTGKSVGNVYIDLTDSQKMPGFKLKVKASIRKEGYLPGDQKLFSKALIRFTYEFSGPDDFHAIAFVDVRLFGNGQHTIDFSWQ